ncbi:MAG: hypothetical protein P0Y52_03210 [Candidatus Brevundimonas phytovorans]|nr:hypothetical protein [Brevundimonas sp.]WEK58559.1 MAG: hypothetical protein P0Y52_03210 [Brevundimonas sp.]
MLKLLKSLQRLALRVVRLSAPLVVAGAAGVAAAADLQISSYSWDPDPVANGAQADFTIRVSNNDLDLINDAVVTVAVPANFTVLAASLPAYCLLSGAPGGQTLQCDLPALPGGDFNIRYSAAATATGSRSSTATISSPTNVDLNPGNDSLTVAPAVQSGADLTVTKTDNEPDHSIPGGGILTYTLTASNAGPDATASIRLTDNLPAAGDFEFISAAGSDWTCTHIAATVVCNYGGAPLKGALPSVTIKGRVLASGGTITNNAFVGLTSPTVLDPDGANNAAAPVVTMIEPGADLEAGKTMPATIIQGDEVDIELTIRNTGPLTVTGAVIVDTIAPEFEIQTPLPAGCLATGQTVSCTANSLSTGQNQKFAIRVTALAPTAGNATNSATVTAPAGITDPTADNNTANASYRIVEPNADLRTSKVKGPNPVEAGQEMTSTITIRNLGPSILNYDAANPLRIVDTVTADETYVSADAPWVCAAAGLAITCELTGPGSLAVGADAVLSLRTLAGTGIDLELSNTACTTSGAQPGDINSANNCASAISRSTPNEADLEIVKEVSLNLAGPWTQTPALAIAQGDAAFYLRFTVRNLGGDTARTVVVTDDLPNFINDAANGFTTGFVLESATQGAPAYTTNNGRITWTVTDLAAGDVETAVVRINRPVESGAFDNTAEVMSPDTTEFNLTNNQSTASYNIAPITDITLNTKSISPARLRSAWWRPIPSACAAWGRTRPRTWW